ncbi:MAG: choice-of-anchor M domain-containing protein, partial [Planctomycetota bacterium]
MIFYPDRFAALCTVALSFVLTGNTSAETITEYSAGHADIRIAFRGGELELLYHFGEGSVLDGVRQSTSFEGQANEAYVRVGDASLDFPGAVSWLGTSASDPVWILPQGNITGQPFLGIATHQMTTTDFSSLTLEMTNLIGPGEFAMWQGLTPPIYWQTNDGIGTNPGDDQLPFPVRGHDHFNYGFTKEGVYQLELTATAEFVAGGSVADTEIFTFVVGNAT